MSTFKSDVRLSICFVVCVDLLSWEWKFVAIGKGTYLYSILSRRPVIGILSLSFDGKRNPKYLCLFLSYLQHLKSYCELTAAPLNEGFHNANAFLIKWYAITQYRWIMNNNDP